MPHVGMLLLGVSRQRHLEMRIRPVRLAAPGATSELADGRRWIQVAAEGTYLGHKSGPFVLDRGVFEQIVANFRRHPAYCPDADGIGCARVVPFDWRHASEAPPEDIVREAAQAWAHELEVRDGIDGCQLWSLTEYLEPARSLIAAGKIAWTSVAVWPNGVDPVSGQSIGWYLSSIAFTNDPFIQGMVPIAADYHFDPYSRPSTANEVLECLRSVFGLPELASLGEVLGELVKLRGMAAGQIAAPPGVDVKALVGQLRIVFNLPTLTPAEEVFAAGDALLSQLAAEAAQPVAATRAAAQPTVIAPKESPMPLLALVAGRLGLAPNTSESVAEEKLVITLEAGNKATKDLAAIMSALGVPDVEAGVAKIAGMFQSVKALEEAMPELASLYTAKAEEEAGAAENDVDAVMKATRMPEEARAALVFMRTGNVELPKVQKDAQGRIGEPERKALLVALTARANARAKFAEKYGDVLRGTGTADAGAGYAHLLGRHFAGQSGERAPTNPFPAQPAQPLDGQRYASPILNAMGGGGRGGAPVREGQLVDLSNVPGANLVDKAKNFLAAQPESKGMTYDQLMEQATLLAEQTASASR